jgi:fluoride exporter
MDYLVVFLGGGIGAAVRHCVNVTFARWFGTGLPFHILFENVTGSFLLGALVGYFAFRGQASQEVRLFLATGILGATRRSRHSREMQCCCGSAAKLLWRQAML